MYFLTTGRLNFFSGLADVISLPEGANICEMVLWVQWRHRGRLVGAQGSELIAISSEDFRMVACRTSSFIQFQRYAQQYAQHFFDQDSPNINDLTDNFDMVQEMAQTAFSTSDATTFAPGFRRSNVSSRHLTSGNSLTRMFF